MSWWSEKLAENEQQQPLPQRAPQIPQTPPPADDSLAGLIEQARASMQMAESAHGVAERFGAEPGADIGTTSRRPRPAAEKAPSLLDVLSPQERAMVVRLATEAGAFENPADLKRTFTGNSVKAAHDNAAMVAELTRAGAFTTSDDNTPGRRVGTRGVAGYTAGQSYGR
jgi:hypothetical protein